MKTFTTYAEKKAKQFFNLLQGYTKGIRFTAILILLLMGVSNVSAWDIGGNGVIFYYANTGSWSGINMYYWGDGWSSNQAFAQISNTKIYYYKFDHTWTNLSGIKFNQAKDDWSKQSSGDITGSNLTSSRYWKGTETSSSTTLAQLNGAAKVITKISTGGNYTEQANAACVVTISGYNLADDATSATAVSAKTGSASSVSINAAYGSTIKYASNTPTGYDFKGFSTSNSTSLPTTLSTTKSVTASKVGGTANTTYYAYYLATQYTITYELNGGSGTMTPTTYNIETATFSLPEPTRNGYKFDGWYENSSFSGTAVTQIAKGTTGNKTFYAKWIQNATYSLLVEAGTGIQSVTGSKDPVTLGSSYSITATPKTGYSFSQWTAEPAANATFASATSANTNVTIKNGSVTVTATATENTHDVTVSYKCGSTTIQDNTTTDAVGEVNAKSITAPDITGYTFTGWTLGTGIVNKSADTNVNPISITTNSTGSGYTLTANYTRNSYTLTFGVQGLGGSVEATENSNAISSPATLEHGTQVTLTATPSSKYEFSKWVNASGTQISTDNPYTHTLTANATVNAVFVNTNVLYLKPNSNWKSDYAWFAAYFFKAGSDEKMWVKMRNVNPCGGSDYYKVQIPEGGWDNVIFCRMNKDQHDLTWENRWDQTKDVTIPTDGKNLYTITEGQWGGNNDNGNGATGSWSTFTPPYHEPVVYNVTVPDGTPNCFIIGEWDGWSEFIKMNKVDDTHYTIALYDACNTHKYKYCYGQSWACQEVAGTGNPTTAVGDRAYKDNDVVVAWIKYCLVGYNNNWDWLAGFEFDFEGKMNQHLATTEEHEFKIMSSIGEYYTTNSKDNNIHKFTREHSSEYIPQTDGSYHNLILNVDLADRYYFHFNPINKLLSITFPEDGYRVKITMSDGAEYTSNAVKNNTDILSFFAPGSTDDNIEGSVKLLYKGKHHADISPELFDISRVYTAKLNSTNNGLTEIAPYKGNMYIRTDAAVGGWNDFRQEGNKMTYSSYAERHSEFNHYFCKWIENPQDGHTNVRFVIANEYNSSISDTLDGDNIINYYDRIGFLPYSANVRFSWDSRTNQVGRAYISGSTNVADRFLVLKGDEKLTDLDGNTFNIEGLNPHEANFADMGNWVYQLDVKAGRGTPIQLTAKYNNIEQQFFSTRGGSALDATSNDSYKVRFIYDFKTNHLVAAWLLDDIQVSDGAVLNSNMLVMRKHHEQAQQLKLNVEKELSAVGTAYGVISFDKYFLNNRDKDGNALAQNDQKSIYERALYWVSFPFDVRIRDVFGFGEYMDTWIMEYYDGEARAKNGAWVDSESYWTYITDLDYVLKAGVGYVLCLDLDKMGYNSSVFAHTDEVSLYFPSIGNVGTINNEPTTVKLDTLDCTIERKQRNIYDDNWHVIGVPVFSNFDMELPEYTEIAQNDVLYYYRYIPATNTYEVAASPSTQTFQVMQAYMVQYAGDITWTGASQDTPAAIAARRNADAGPEKVSLNLELAQDDITADKTFIQLQEEGATADFDMNKDLTKILNAGANIYTIVGEHNIQTAGNVLPMNECEIPVGVKVDAAGEYTFRMPDGTEGMVVELIDYYTNTRTNLLLSDYTVDLTAGTCEDRFALHIQPSKSGVATDIEQTIGTDLNAEGVQKYIIDGRLYLKKDGVLYDAQGHSRSAVGVR